jgi:fermentation-respiration switch protein FrsA (DUF1100 family)
MALQVSSMAHSRSLLPLLAGLPLAAAGGLLSAAWYVGRRINPPPRRTFLEAYTFTPWELQIPFETISFSSSDGLCLRGWWMPHPGASAVVIGCHGHSGSKADLLGIGSNTWRAGYHVLLFDMRGRGDSDPWPQSLVSREVEDLLAAVAWVRRQQPEARIGVIGYSMGAAVTILAAARNPAIAAVVADSAFISGSAVVDHAITRAIGVSAPLLRHAADAFVARRYGYRFSAARPIDVVGTIAPRPMLFFHSEADSLVPVDHARQIYAAAGHPKELVITPEAEHCGSYFADRPGYCRRVAAFFDQSLGRIG